MLDGQSVFIHPGILHATNSHARSITSISMGHYHHISLRDTRQCYHTRTFVISHHDTQDIETPFSAHMHHDDSLDINHSTMHPRDLFLFFRITRLIPGSRRLKMANYDIFSVFRMQESAILHY